ncbi:response regulator [Sinomonas atrocyanea]|uniref:response regulator n=1 Tax=Sinomonas atrocyanea TaxID=37927 RepID=UPI0027885A38|nr:response regulator [Sinomonas atrocyanea]MDQ0261923.1 DNA-binding NarL/FixJ family response regulator [Sinomonas atrocyanea]MDR6623687.1 DNA-binding NarL/FixJ family response regulator [Sinomonas atrocyanea]
MFLLISNELARKEIRRLFQLEGMQVVGESTSARQALFRIRVLGPDVTVMDSRIADGRGIEVCLRARESVPGLGCVVLVSYPHEAEGPGARHCEFVLREVTDHGLVDAVRRAAAQKGPSPGGKDQ